MVNQSGRRWAIGSSLSYAASTLKPNTPASKLGQNNSVTTLALLLLLQNQSPAEQTTLLAQDFLAKNPVAAVTVAVVRNGKTLYAQGFGYQDVAKGIKADENTRIRLASISKTITATAVMKLVEQGKLNLDKPITNYVPEWPESKPAISLRQILTHSSGIRHYTGGNEGAIFTHYTLGQAIGLFSKSDLLFPPGTKTSYSTHAFTVAARAIETASKQDFGDFMRSQIIKPSGVKDLDIEDSLKPAPANRSQVYYSKDGKPVQYAKREDLSWKYGGGGFEASALSLAKWGSALLAGKILKPSTLDQMWTAQKLNDGTRIQSLGWVISDDNQLVHHSGAQQGSRTHFYINRKTKTVVTVLCNTSGAALNEIEGKIYDLWAK